MGHYKNKKLPEHFSLKYELSTELTLLFALLKRNK